MIDPASVSIHRMPDLHAEDGGPLPIYVLGCALAIRDGDNWSFGGAHSRDLSDDQLECLRSLVADAADQLLLTANPSSTGWLPTQESNMWQLVINDPEPPLDRIFVGGVGPDDVVVDHGPPAAEWGLGEHQWGQLTAWPEGEGWAYVAVVALDLPDDRLPTFRQWAAIAINQLVASGDPEANGWGRSSVPGRWYMTASRFDPPGIG